MYEQFAVLQSEDSLKKVLLALREIELSEANKMLELVQKKDANFKMPEWSRRAKVKLWLGKYFGYDSIISDLSSIERAGGNAVVREKMGGGEKPSGFEHNHLKIIEAVGKSNSAEISKGLLSKFEGRHRSVGGNAVRAAVLGANDGLVSNLSLVMGVAGAATDNKLILLTGLVGLLAGAISMAMGEWLSVQSSSELHLQQIALETQELESSPEDEKKELILLYQAKGMDFESASILAEKIFENPETALDALIVEELGIDKEELGGSAWEAAFVSFFLFAIGAIIPVAPYMLYPNEKALYLSVGGSILGLFGIGAAITLFTGKNVLFSGLRQVIFGLAAAAVTYGIGTLIGVSLAG